MINFRWILLGVMPMFLMGCGTKSHTISLGDVMVVSHVDAGGKKLMVMTPSKDARWRFVSHKQINFKGAPDINDTTIFLNVAAAFTLDLSSMDVCGDHVVAGERIKGYDDVTATGHMLIVDDKVRIASNEKLEQSIQEAVDGKGYLFQQCLIVEDGKGFVERVPEALLKRNPSIIYRAVCVKADGSVVAVQGDEAMLVSEFVDALVAFGVRQALYLDMGTWAWGWVREWDKLPQELSEHFFNTRFQSNWLQVTL